MIVLSYTVTNQLQITRLLESQRGLLLPNLKTNYAKDITEKFE